MAVLFVNNLSKTYRIGTKQLEAVRSVSLSLAAGEVLAFLGPNGAGKTTTIKMIAGLIRPDTGEIRINDIDPHRDTRALRYLGAVLEGNRNLYWRLTPLENLEYFGVLKGITHREARRRAKELLEQFDLAIKRTITVENLSRGMQQKVALAVALIHRPQLLLLDEPTLGLDVEATQIVKALVKDIAASGCAIVLTTHQLNIAEELSDRVVIMQRGSIIASSLTRDLLREFSGTAYWIEVEGEIDPLRREALQQIGATIECDASGKGQALRIFYAGAPEGLYQVLACLKPLPIVQVKKDAADLTAIFLKLVQQDNHDKALYR